MSLFQEVLGQAEEAGVVRSDLDRDTVTGVVLEAIVCNVFSAIIDGRGAHDDDEQPEHLWRLIFFGIGSPAGRRRLSA